MVRTCFQCGKPLPIERRNTVFCGERCRQIDAQLRRNTHTEPPPPPKGNARSPWRGPPR